VKGSPIPNRREYGDPSHDNDAATTFGSYVSPESGPLYSTSGKDICMPCIKNLGLDEEEHREENVEYVHDAKKKFVRASTERTVELSSLEESLVPLETAE
jgi:hypothetical protein